MQLVVVMAVRNAVSAATTTFTAISITLFFIIHLLFYSHTDLTDLTDFLFLRNVKISFPSLLPREAYL